MPFNLKVDVQTNDWRLVASSMGHGTMRSVRHNRQWPTHFPYTVKSSHSKWNYETATQLCHNVCLVQQCCSTIFFNLHENTPLICCARSKRTFILYKSTIVKGIGEIWALFPIKQMEKHEHKSELDISILTNMLNAHQTQRTRIKLLLHSKSNVECHRRSNPQINKSKLIFRFSFPLFQLH